MMQMHPHAFSPTLGAKCMPKGSMPGVQGAVDQQQLRQLLPGASLSFSASQDPAKLAAALEQVGRFLQLCWSDCWEASMGW